MMFPIGTKIKKFNDKIILIAQLQKSDFDTELDHFYNRIPLKKEPFEKMVLEKSIITPMLRKSKSKKLLSKKEIENIKKIQSQLHESRSNKSKKIIKI
jgi:hypothetical protein